MNYCTKCQSYYQQPGTCNCFATVSPSLPIPYPRPVTWPPPPTPYPYPYPYTPYPLPYTTSPTIIWGNIGNDLTRTITSGEIVNTGSVSWKNAAGNQPLQGSFTENQS